jgi:hypothetical protein
VGRVSRDRIHRARRALALTFALGAGACASRPGEVERLRVETELLREELRIVKGNCSYYRDVEMEVEEESPPGR